MISSFSRAFILVVWLCAVASPAASAGGVAAAPEARQFDFLVGQWQVSGVLDWEFAFAGGPSFDLANLLRPPAGARPGFAASVQAGYLAGGGKLEDCWQRRAAIADLYSWVDFLARPSSSDAVLRDAAAMIARIVAGARAGVQA